MNLTKTGHREATGRGVTPTDAEVVELRRFRPYPVRPELRRFSARSTAFARARCDLTSADYEKVGRSLEKVVARRKSGYSREHLALAAGAWAMASRMHEPGGNTATGKPMESVEPQQESRYEPEDWGAFTQRLKNAAGLYGGAMVGVTQVDPVWVYASDGEGQPIELSVGVRTAVVLAVEMDYQMLRFSPSVTASAATGDGYSRMAFAAACTARFLAALGWRAIPSGNDTALSIPLAIDAGLGELGRNGLLITPRFGPRVRLCKVFTDAPLVPDRPMTFGVTDFCQVCLKCADACPSGSISRDDCTWAGPTPANNPGALKWYVHADRCLAFWRANGTSCANCIRSCPFNKPQGWLHDAARFFIRRRRLMLNRLFVVADNWLGYGRQQEPE